MFRGYFLNLGWREMSRASSTATRSLLRLMISLLGSVESGPPAYWDGPPPVFGRFAYSVL